MKQLARTALGQFPARIFRHFVKKIATLLQSFMVRTLSWPSKRLSCANYAGLRSYSNLGMPI
ncbi:MAG: hypothetical protein NTV25_02515 [Methanothrix sp.]|nr:hypothetical protein [Methanothrix sp.]